MTKPNALLQRINSKLDQLEVLASSIEAHLEIDGEEANSRVENHRVKLVVDLDKLKRTMHESKALAANVRRRVLDALLHVQVQLVFAKTETSEQIQDSKNKIAEATMVLGASLDREIDQADGKLKQAIDDWVRQSLDFDAELEVVWLMHQLKRAARDTDRVAQFEQRKKEIAVKIKEFKERIGDKHRVGAKKIGMLEGELSKNMKRIKKACLS